MRRIFTSPRLENVETVNRLLVEAGINTRLLNVRSWNRGTKRDFSYTQAGRQADYRWPELWVVEAEDYARARQLLREAGVDLETTRSTAGKPSFLPDAAPRPSGDARRPYPWGQRIRIALIAIVAGLTLLHVLRLAGIV